MRLRSWAIRPESLRMTTRRQRQRRSDRICSFLAGLVLVGVVIGLAL